MNIAYTKSLPLWKEYEEFGLRGGHGGMDYLVLRAFTYNFVIFLINFNNFRLFNYYVCIFFQHFFHTLVIFVFIYLRTQTMNSRALALI